LPKRGKKDPGIFFFLTLQKAVLFQLTSTGFAEITRLLHKNMSLMLPHEKIPNYRIFSVGQYWEALE